MDSRVLQTQQWLNQTYGNVEGFPAVTEDGITGNATFHALIYALQIEIGVENPDGVFGNDTLNKCPTLSASLIPDSEVPRNIIYILQGSLWCKGISPGGFTGIFGPLTANAVYEFQTAAGITADKIVYPYVLQGIMNTDGYSFQSTDDVYDTYKHEIQLGLNKNYGATIGLIAPNGIWERKSHKNLIKAIQIEWGTTVDGSFGNGTLSKAPTLSRNTNGYTNSKRLLQWCLTINGFYPGSFSGTFDTNTYNSLYAFQEFVGLDADGICGKQTWASLITSRGASDRPATALDTSKKITLENATAIKAAGYTDVGRYLTNTPNSTLDKAMSFDELEILLAAGLNVFPIFQTRGNEASYFSADQGTADAITAKSAAYNFGFPSSATIYFCVDYDVLMADIENNILPYFRSVKEVIGDDFKIGAYGPRYICTKLAEMNLTTSSFVCDMSSGFTCNIGQKLPENWAYDQFCEISVANSEFSEMDYDKCIASTRKTATAPEDFLPSLVGYDNSRYSYEQVLSGTGFYQQDSKSRYSAGVATLQGKLNTAGYRCGTPDGIFGSGTTIAVNDLKSDNGLTVNGRVDKDTLVALEACKAASSSARNLKRKHGPFISSLSTQHNIDEDILGGFILTESSSYGFVDEKLLIRFENHWFLNLTTNSSAPSLFKVENGTHYYYKNEQWNETHNNQSTEYEAFELAKTIDETAAYEAISMGLPQIMGFNHSEVGYNSAQDMFNDFSISEDNQMIAFGTFIVNYSNYNGVLLTACQSRNFYLMGEIYNNNGTEYGPLLEQNAADYANTL